jgi:hypothetical protein
MLSSEGDNETKEKSNEVSTSTSLVLLERVYGGTEGYNFNLSCCQRTGMAYCHYTFGYVSAKLKYPLLK